jgi:hypothetical protein
LIPNLNKKIEIFASKIMNYVLKSTKSHKKHPFLHQKYYKLASKTPFSPQKCPFKPKNTSKNQKSPQKSPF